METNAPSEASVKLADFIHNRFDPLKADKLMDKLHELSPDMNGSLAQVLDKLSTENRKELTNYMRSL